MGAFDNIRNAISRPDSTKKAMEESSSEPWGLTTVGEDVGGRMIDRGGMSVAKTVAPTKAIFQPDYVQLNDLFLRVLYVDQWPNKVRPNWLREILQWDRSIDVVVHYLPIPRDQYIKALKQKISREGSQLKINTERGAPPEYDRIARYEHAKQMLEMMATGESNPLQLALLINIRASSLQELNDLTEKVRRTLRGLNCTTRTPDFLLREGLLSCLPLGRNYLADDYTTRNMHSQAAQFCFAFANADLSHPDGIWYGINRSTNSNVIIDRFRLNSPHALIMGQAGSGKSFAAKLEMLRSLMDGVPVVAIDPEAECDRLAEYVGGQFITIGPNSPDRINVLDFSHSADGINDVVGQKVLSLLKLMGQIFNPQASGMGLDAAQVTMLDSVLRGMYADFGYTQDPRTQLQSTSQRMPVLSDLRAKLEQTAQAFRHQPGRSEMLQKMADSLGPYCSGGVFGGLFDQKTTVELNANFVAFNVKPLTGDEHLMRLGMHTVLEFIWQTVMNRRAEDLAQRRLIFIDEAHVMLRHPDSASFLEQLARRARKCNVGCTFISQDPADFASEQGKALLGNAPLKMLFKLERRMLEVAAPILGLSEVEASIVAQSGVGEGILMVGQDRAWVSMHTASPEEAQVITTRPEEVAAIAQGAAEQAALPEHSVDSPSTELPGQTTGGQTVNGARIPGVSGGAQLTAGDEPADSI
jgi:hypothetical protein